MSKIWLVALVVVLMALANCEFSSEEMSHAATKLTVSKICNALNKKASAHPGPIAIACKTGDKAKIIAALKTRCPVIVKTPGKSKSTIALKICPKVSHNEMSEDYEHDNYGDHPYHTSHLRPGYSRYYHEEEDNSE